MENLNDVGDVFGTLGVGFSRSFGSEPARRTPLPWVGMWLSHFANEIE
ncbi:MAG: hypothetical protein AAF198_08840 [Pseudomonadota bacterium]